LGKFWTNCTLFVNLQVNSTDNTLSDEKFSDK
jgi:hypothetical protein